jgi:hypothetical protein
VKAANEAETILAEEAVLMAEALADVTLATTIASADADNSRQQTSINNRLGAKPCLAVATQRWHRGGSGSISGGSGTSSGLALWRGEVADRMTTKVEAATEAAAATTAKEEAVAEAAAAQQQQRCHGGGGGGRLGGRGDDGNISGGSGRGSGGNEGSGGNRGSG